MRYSMFRSLRNIVQYSIQYLNQYKCDTLLKMFKDSKVYKQFYALRKKIL